MTTSVTTASIVNQWDVFQSYIALMCLLDYQRRDRQLAIRLMLTNAEWRRHILRTKRIHLSVLKAETD